MTTRDDFRSLRSENWPQPSRVMTAAWPVRLTGRRPAGKSARCYTAFTRRAVLPVCDGLALLLAALLTVTGWVAVGYAAAALIFLRFSGQHRLRICLRVSDEIPRLAAAAALPIPLFLFWIELGRLVRLAALSAGLRLAMRFASYALRRAATRQ